MEPLYYQIIYMIVLLIPFLISGAAFFNFWLNFLLNRVEHDISGEEFDFIIVGAGSAGSVLANRLSEDPFNKVLLLEAGGTPSFLSGIPILATYLQLTDNDWQFKTEPQTHACGAMEDRRCRWPSGKMLGGSSGLNYMLYVRGNPLDFDEWDQEVGGQGEWAFQNISKYFDSIKEESAGPGSLSYGLPVRDAIFTTEMAEEYLEMGRRNGFSVGDLNSENQTGFMIPQVTLSEDGTRGDAYRSFLKPVLFRPNLTVRKHAKVTRIDITSSGKSGFKKATGVTFTQFGETLYVRARKEIIISAGAVNSPKLLLLSGIGPKNDLKKLKIKVEADLPVGRNLQDHITTMLGPFILNKEYSFSPLRYFGFHTLWKYFYNGTGPMTSTLACDALAFFNSKSNTDLRRPDLQLHFISSSLLSDFWTFFWKTFGFDGGKIWGNYIQYLYYPKNMNSVTILPVVLRPRSRGVVKLASNNPNQEPLVDPRYFHEKEDLDLLVEAIQTTLQMINNSQLPAELDFKLPKRNFPGCDGQPLFSKKYWRCFVTQVSLTMYHPIGTCKMANDRTGVVDSRLRVKGVTSLRVADASIMPSQVTGNTNAAVIMIGEKASHMILEDWAKPGVNGEDNLKTKEEL